jgi:hypothetical protein
MANRTGNYTAFYVNEPFSESNLNAHAAKDFVTYNQLRMWKGSDDSFPFVNSHEKTYNVRDDSDWEQTLKPRLHERLNRSKNIILILSSVTKNSRALKEEIDFGINENGLPVIVIYPEYNECSAIAENKKIKNYIQELWDKIPTFRDSMNKVPTIHIPNKKELIKKALNNVGFSVTTKCKPGVFFYES